MVALQIMGLVALCLIGVALAVFARKLVAWQVRSTRNMDPDRRQYIQGFLSYNSPIISVETWLLRIAGTVVALGSAFVLSLFIASHISY